MTAHPIEIVAHRGASHDAPENTLAAVELAWAQRADAVEIDCRMTHDGQVVVIHDADTERTAGAKFIVAESTCDQLRTLDVGQWKDAAFAGERIALLEAVIETLPAGKRLFIEVKCGAQINDSLVDILRHSGHPAEAFGVISYDLEVVRGVKHALPDIAAYLVARFQHDVSSGWSPSIDELIKLATTAQLDGLDVQARTYVDSRFVAQARDANLETYVWTVDDAREAQRLIDAGVSGIATNRPAWLREALVE